MGCPQAYVPSRPSLPRGVLCGLQSLGAIPSPAWGACGPQLLRVRPALVWRGHSLSAVSLPWCEVAMGPQMYHRPSCVDRLFPGVHLQSCPFPHAFFCVIQVFPFMPTSPGSYSLLSNMWELFKSSLGVTFELLGYQSCLRQHKASSHKGCPAAVCCQSSLVYTWHNWVFFCSVTLKNANLIIKFKISEFW